MNYWPAEVTGLGELQDQFFRYLEMLRRRFGSETAEEVKRMPNHRLERDLLTSKLAVPDVLLPAEDAAGRTPLAQLELMSG